MLAGVVLLVLTVLVLLRVLGAERGTLAVLLVGALPLSLLPAYAVLAVAAARARWVLAAWSAVLVAAHLLVVAPALGAAPPPVGADGAARLRVVTANLFLLNPDPRAAGEALRALRPDVLVVPELSRDGLAGLTASGLLADLPHASTPFPPDGPTDRAETVGLFSRLPLDDLGTRVAGGRQLPRGTVTVDGVPVRVLAAHPLPPVSVLEQLWRASLADLLREADDVRLPLVVAGDLNADRDHAPFRRLLGTGLRDAHDVAGRGLARTWPASTPLLHLDHVLVRDGGGGRLAVLDVAEVELPGSDHLAVVADLAVLPA